MLGATFGRGTLEVCLAHGARSTTTLGALAAGPAAARLAAAALARAGRGRRDGRKALARAFLQRGRRRAAPAAALLARRRLRWGLPLLGLLLLLPLLGGKAGGRGQVPASTHTFGRGAAVLLDAAGRAGKLGQAGELGCPDQWQQEW